MNIHPQAIVHPDAVLGEGVSIGPFTLIGAGVRIGDGCEIASHVVVETGTEIGPGCRIHQGASLGGAPQVAGFDKNIKSSVHVGKSTVIREYVTIHRSMYEGKATEVGEHCMLMAYSHVGHDCKIEGNVVIVNQTGLSGHVEIGEHAFVSGMVGIHQFVRIGAHCMVGGFSVARQDVLPYSMVEGVPLRLVSTNSVGLRRRNFRPPIRAALKKALAILKDDDLNTSQAVERIQAEIENTDEIRYLINFIQASSRGIIK